MNCLEFERLLDEGTPDQLPEAALDHARSCAVCSGSLERARALEAALEHHFATLASPAEQAPLTGFTDRVMLRVERGEARDVRGRTQLEALPWWVRVAAEPAVVLACVVGALLLWQGEALSAAVRAWAARGAPTGTGATAWLPLDAIASALRSAFAPTGGPDWAVITGLALGVAPLVAIVSWVMWRAGEQLAGARHSLR